MINEIVHNRIYTNSGASWLAVVGLDQTPTTKPAEPKDKVEVTVDGQSKDIPVASWGSNNLLPFELLNDIKSVTVVGSGIRKRTRIHFGRGVVAFERQVVDGKEEIVPTQNADWKEFLKNNNINNFALASITDFECFAIAFPEYVLDAGGNSKIVRVYHKHAPYCRISIKEKDKDGVYRSKWVVYSPKWEEGSPDKETGVAIPLLDPNFSIEQAVEYLQTNKITKFIRPIVMYMPTHDYYPVPWWNSAREAGWIEYLQLIVKVKKAIIQNSMTLKYIVKIPLDYWDKKYPSTQQGMTPEKKKILIDEDLQKLDNFLKDFENTGSSLITYFDYDPVTKRQVGAWEIDVVDTKIKDGVLNIDSAAANSEVLFAIGIDPSLIGSGLPGKELGAKSGSDKREAYNIAIADAMPDRMQILSSLDFIAQFNGWENIEFAFEDNILTTLDKNPTGIQKRSI